MLTGPYCTATVVDRLTALCIVTVVGAVTALGLATHASLSACDTCTCPGRAMPRCPSPRAGEQQRLRAQPSARARNFHLPEGEVPIPGARETAGSSKWKAGGERAVEAKQKQRHHRRRGSGNGTRSPPHSTRYQSSPTGSRRSGHAPTRPNERLRALNGAQSSENAGLWCPCPGFSTPPLVTRDSLSRLHYAGEMPSPRMEEARCGALG